MDPNASTVIARRLLRDTQTEQPVEVVVYQPVLDPANAQGIWVCRVEITRGGVSLGPVEARGVDSLQALIVGMAAIRYTLKTQLEKLAWLGDPGEIGLPLIIQEDDQDFV